MPGNQPLSKKTAISASGSTYDTLHILSDTEIKEREWMLNLIVENNQQDILYKESTKKEILHFARFINTMILAFPAGLATRKYIRRNPQLNHILQFKELLPVRNNIEKGSFAYDTLLFGQSFISILQNKSHLANLVCLAILFGDEFIDGIAVTYGKESTQKILDNTEVNYYLQYKDTVAGPEIFYEFDIRKMLPAEVLSARNAKYGISYTEFYDHLLFLLAEMNRHLSKLNKAKAKEAAALICKACNRCFDTYKIDVAEFDINYSLEHLLSYQQKKDDDIINVLLQLRGTLLNKQHNKYQQQFGSWSTMVRSMQLYDDMQDVDGDYNYQMNFICYFARNHFKKEWLWLEYNTKTLQNANGIHRHLLICIHMPSSVMLLMEYNKNIIQKNLNWVQKKITAYLWKKNWLGWKNEQLAYDCGAAFGKNYLTVKDKLVFLQEKIVAVKESMITEEMQYSHLLHTALIDPQLKEDFFEGITKKEKYFLKNSLFDYPLQKKQVLTQRWLLRVL
jgi:hypothetical protein